MARAARAYSARSAMYERVLQPIRPKKMWDTKTLSAPERKHLIIFSGLRHWRWQCKLGTDFSMTGTLIGKKTWVGELPVQAMLSIPKPKRVRRRNEASQIGRRGRERQEQPRGGRRWPGQPTGHRSRGAGSRPKCIMCECGGMMMTIAAATQIVSLR